MDRGRILLAFDFFSFLFFLVARMRCREWRKDFFFVMLKLVLFYFSFEFILFKSFQFLRRSTVEATQGKGCIFTEHAERFEILILEDELNGSREDSSFLRFLFVSFPFLSC